MNRVLTICMIILSVAGSVLASSLNDCFTDSTAIYNYTGESDICLEIDFPYYLGQYQYGGVITYSWQFFCPRTRIAFTRPGTNVILLKGTCEADNYVGIGPCETVFMKVDKGTVITEESFYGNPRIFQHVNSPGAATITSDYNITVRTGSDKRKVIYLAFLTWSLYNEPAIGWIALEADSSISGGILYVVGSAITTDGNPVTVGTPLTLDPIELSWLLEGGVRQLDIYVDASVAVSGDGCSWASPFKTIQEGVDAVRLDGTVVHVKPGIYEPVLVDNSKFTLNNLAYTFTVESTDGPHATIIQGGEISGSLNGCTAATSGCFWYGEDPVNLYDVVRGFTLCNAVYGGKDGRFEECIVSNCLFGLYGAIAVNCILVDNFRAGTESGTIYNCVSTRNGYGISSTTAYNSIIEGNLVSNNLTIGYYSYNSCSTPLPLRGTGNITNAPLFVSAETGDLRLRAGSPCIDAGSNEFCQSDTDLAGNRRVQGFRVDMGCYEYGAGTNGTTVTTPVAVPYTWLEQYADVPLNAAEEDYEAAAMRESGKKGAAGMPLTLWQEYVQGTVPSDSNDCFQASISLEGRIGVSFVPCWPDRRYTLYGSRSLNGPWASTMDFDSVEFVQTNRFFKVGVELR